MCYKPVPEGTFSGLGSFSNTFLVLSSKLDPNLLQSYQNNSKVKISQLTSFTGSIVYSENFYIYELCTGQKCDRPS